MGAVLKIRPGRRGRWGGDPAEPGHERRDGRGDDCVGGSDHSFDPSGHIKRWIGNATDLRGATNLLHVLGEGTPRNMSAGHDQFWVEK